MEGGGGRVITVACICMQHGVQSAVHSRARILPVIDVRCIEWFLLLVDDEL